MTEVENTLDSSTEGMDVDCEEVKFESSEITVQLPSDITESDKEGTYVTPEPCDKENGSPTCEKEKYPCPLCTKEFQNKSGRYNHIRLHHKLRLEFGKVHCLEVGCLFSCTYTTVLQQHLTAVHNIPMQYLNLEFDNYEEFEKWKHDFETGEVCRFVKKSGARVGDTGKSMYLYCSRSGTFVSQGKGRRCKKLGTAKISAHCTALIKYFEESSGKVKATVCSTHYGHDRDHRFLRLTKLQKRRIAEQMKSGVPRELVLDSVRSSFVNKLDRIHELSKKDLNNIQKSFNIPKQPSEARKSGSSGSSGGSSSAFFNPWNVIYDSWTKEIDIGAESPVLVYKEANVESPIAPLKPEDKCLIMMTKGQRDLLVKFCNNGVLYATVLRLSCILPLFLIAVFVLDDFYEMFPVCFMVANDNRADMFRVCFGAMLNVVGPVVLRAFATDNQPHIFDAWCDVMGPATRNLVLANRYVDAEWRNNLEMVKNEALQGEIYDQLYAFVERDDGTEEHLRALIEELRQSYTSSSFATYLEKYFLANVRLWSTHYLRRTCNLHEPIDYEISYGRIATLCELCCKYNKSVDYAALGLIKLLLDYQSARNRRIAEHVVEIQNAHAASSESGTECVFPLANASWKVRSNSARGDQRQQFCSVVAQRCDIEDCVLACDQCEACVHTFRCDCDAYTETKTCVHVHLVGTTVKTSAASSRVSAAERSADEQMLGGCNVDDGGDAALLADADECCGGADDTSELRSLRVETHRALDDISKKLANIRDENSLKRVHELLRDVQSNVDVILHYGEYAKNVECAKTSKPVKKKKKASGSTTSSRGRRPNQKQRVDSIT